MAAKHSDIKYDFSAPAVVRKIARLARQGATILAIARAFGYQSAGGFTTALQKPEHAAAVEALHSARLRGESLLLARIWRIAANKKHPLQLRACTWLLEHRFDAAEEHAANGAGQVPAMPPSDFRQRLMLVKDAQRAAS